MAIESEADRLEMLKGLGAELVTIAKTGTQVYGILAKEYVSGGRVEGYQPVLTARTRDVGGLAHGEQLTIGGVVYLTWESKDDGTGMTEVVLKLAVAP